LLALAVFFRPQGRILRPESRDHVLADLRV
jgi:hypothetical protein